MVVSTIPPEILAMMEAWVPASQEVIHDNWMEQQEKVLDRQWSGTVWFERQKYPWPLAQRENLFALHMEPSDGGDRVRAAETQHSARGLPPRRSTGKNGALQQGALLQSRLLALKPFAAFLLFRRRWNDAFLS